MNQTQRNFLVDKIQSKLDAERKALESQLPERPSLEGFLVHEIMKGTIEMQSTEFVKDYITDRVINLKKGESLLGDRWSSSKNEITLPPSKLFVIPEEYARRMKEYEKKSAEIRGQISELAIQAETMITRIKLASNSVLEGLVRDVDNMGDIRLVDTTLKKLLK